MTKRFNYFGNNGKWKVKKQWRNFSNVAIPSLKNNFTGAATLICIVYVLSIEWSQLMKFDLFKSLSRVQAIFFVSGLLEVLTCVSTLLTCSRSRSVHSALSTRLKSMAALLSDYRLNKLQQNLSPSSPFVTLFRQSPVVLSFILTVAEIFIYYNNGLNLKLTTLEHGEIDLSRLWWVTRAALIYNRFYNHTFITTVAKIGHAFRILNEEFLTITKYGKDGLKVRFITLKFAYDVTVELCERINIEFGVRNLMVLITDTVVFVWTLYSVAALAMVSLLEGHRFDINVIVNEVQLWLWGILLAVELVLITSECDSTTKSANELAEKVYTHKSGNAFITIKDQLKYFKLQQLHYSLKMTVLGLFPLNYSLLGSMTETIARYLVIMVQFSLMVTPSLSVLQDMNEPHNKNQSNVLEPIY